MRAAVFERREFRGLPRHGAKRRADAPRHIIERPPVDDLVHGRILAMGAMLDRAGHYAPAHQSRHRYAVEPLLPADLLVHVSDIGPGHRRRHAEVTSIDSNASGSSRSTKMRRAARHLANTGARS